MITSFVPTSSDSGLRLIQLYSNISRPVITPNTILTLELDRAVEKAVEMTSPDDTLIIVTADHSHTFSLGANLNIGKDMFARGNIRTALDGKASLFLTYSDGPGWSQHRSRSKNFGNETMRKNMEDDIKSGQTGSIKYVFDAPIPLTSESHGAEDVGMYARGPMAHLLTGTQEQNFIAHAAMRAACIGPYTDHCGEEHLSCEARLSKSLTSSLYMLPLFTILLSFQHST